MDEMDFGETSPVAALIKAVNARAKQRRIPLASVGGRLHERRLLQAVQEFEREFGPLGADEFDRAKQWLPLPKGTESRSPTRQ